MILHLHPTTTPVPSPMLFCLITILALPIAAKWRTGCTICQHLFAAIYTNKIRDRQLFVSQFNLSPSSLIKIKSECMANLQQFLNRFRFWVGALTSVMLWNVYSNGILLNLDKRQKKIHITNKFCSSGAFHYRLKNSLWTNTLYRLACFD